MSRGEKPSRGRTNNWFTLTAAGVGDVRRPSVGLRRGADTLVGCREDSARPGTRGLAGGHAKFWFTLTAVLLIWGPGWGTLGALQAACAAGSTWVWVVVRAEPFMRRRATRQKQFLVHVDGCFSALGPGMGEAGVFRASRRRGAVAGVDFPRE